MKNVKLIMTAVGVFAIVGTALALNGRRNAPYCTGSTASTCTTIREVTETPTGTLMFAAPVNAQGNCQNVICTSRRIVFEQ